MSSMDYLTYGSIQDRKILKIIMSSIMQQPITVEYDYNIFIYTKLTFLFDMSYHDKYPWKVCWKYNGQLDM